MNRKSTYVFGLAALVALMLSAAFAGSAMAAGPAWKFNGEELKGTETMVGGAQKSGLTASGVHNHLRKFPLQVEIWNSGGTGKGNVTELPLFNCYTDTTCTVEAIEAESFPGLPNWSRPAATTT